MHDGKGLNPPVHKEEEKIPLHLINAALRVKG
jgi:hypothetical protein